MSHSNNVDALAKPFGHENKRGKWRLLIDASKTSLKHVLLDRGNKCLSVPVFRSTQDKRNIKEQKNSMLHTI
jgi:hypothetical protein